MPGQAAGEVWVFDVDGCLVDSLTGTSLRPEATRVLERVREHAARVVLWSAGGADYARRRAEEHGVGHLFDAFFAKDRRDDTGRYAAPVMVVGAPTTVFVDDQPGDLPVGADVIPVRPYLTHDPHDTGLVEVARRVGLAR